MKLLNCYGGLGRLPWFFGESVTQELPKTIITELGGIRLGLGSGPKNITAEIAEEPRRSLRKTEFPVPTKTQTAKIA